MQVGKKTRIYLDYNATAPILPGVLAAIQRVMGELPGNPSSPHIVGQEAKECLESARRRLAALIGFGRRELIFTSGGSESNGMVFNHFAFRDTPTHIITSPIEHSSVLANCEWLAERGVEVSYLPVNGQGVAEVEAVVELMRPETRLVSLMAANNETGVVQPIERLVRLVREHQGESPVMIHSDAVQAFGKIPFNPAQLGVDAVSLTAHKMGGPHGIGALAIREEFFLNPLIRGGGQERGLRAGTENIAGIEGFASAGEWVWERFQETTARLTALREKLISRLESTPGFFLNGAGAPHLPNTLNLGFDQVEAQSLLVALDLEGVAISAGSACQSGGIESSHVLKAMGLTPERINSSVRISLGHGTTEEEIERCGELMLAQVARLRKITRKHAS